MEDYARSVGADFEVLGGSPEQLHPKIGMLRDIVQWAETCEPEDRLLYVDADVFIRTGAPDLFEMAGVPNAVWACQGFLPQVREDWKKWMTTHYDLDADETRYINAGVFMLDGLAAKGAAPFLHRPYIAGCMDQHQVNAAILLSGVSLFHLPYCWNAKASWLRERIPDGVNFVHFVGHGMTQKVIIEYTIELLSNRGFVPVELSRPTCVSPGTVAQKTLQQRGIGAEGQGMSGNMMEMDDESASSEFETAQAEWRLGFWANRPTDSCISVHEAVEELILDKAATIRGYQTHELGGFTVYSLDEGKMKCLTPRTRFFLRRLEGLLSKAKLKLPLELVCYFPDCFLSRRLNFFDLRFPLIVEGRHCLNSAGILFTAPERYWREWNRMPPGFDEIPFLKKKPILFGRLSLNGSYVNQAGELVVGYPSANHLFDHFDRVKFVTAASGKDRCNAGLTVRKDMELAAYPPAAQRVIRRWFRAPSTVDEQLKYRYLVSIDGRGYSGSLYWMLASNSVVFRSEPRYHTAFEVGLRPFIHYIPLLPNFSDIDEKIDWCENNPEECERITRNAHAYLRKFFDPKMEDRVNIRILESIGGSYSARLE